MENEEAKTITLQFDTKTIDLILRGLGKLPTEESVWLYSQLTKIRFDMENNSKQWTEQTPEPNLTEKSDEKCPEECAEECPEDCPKKSKKK